jgi:serine/threonine protein kinase
MSTEAECEEVLAERRRPDMSWTVCRHENVLVKVYRLHQWTSLLRRPWAREHSALKRLNQRGVFSPQTYGYESQRSRTIRYRREFLHGHSVHALSQEQVSHFGAHLAALHSVGLTNGDVSYGNLLLADGKGLLLIDFGRARTFMFTSPLSFSSFGKELARVRRRLFPTDASTWHVFLADYVRAAPSGRALRFTRWSLSFWLRRWQIADDSDRICRRTAPHTLRLVPGRK